MQNSMLVPWPCGTGAQTNMEPWLSGTSQPMERKPPHRASRRRWYSAHWALMGSSGPVIAAMAAFCSGMNLPKCDLGAQLLACGNHIAAAHQKADARAGHVEALAQGEELDCAGLGARNVEDAVAHGTIKDDIAVGVIMDEQNLMCIAEIHDLLVQLRAAHAAHRVGRQGIRSSSWPYRPHRQYRNSSRLSIPSLFLI